MGEAKFIVLEGIDGSGSTTQAKKLANYLISKDEKIYLTAQPSKNPVGLQIRKLLNGSSASAPKFRREQLALLYAADRLEHYALEIEIQLKAGVNVICDRYLMSSLAYQGLDLSDIWVENLNKYAPSPDKTIFIDVHEDIAESRRHKRGEDPEFFDDLKFQKNVRQRYLSLVKKLNVEVVNGDGNEKDVFESILTCLGVAK